MRLIVYKNVILYAIYKLKRHYKKMNTLIYLGIVFIAVEHLLFMVLETFLWTHPIGLKVFSQNKTEARKSRVLAANQGIYNGVLALGLFYLLVRNASYHSDLLLFLLSMITIVGVYGGMSVSKTILVVQALPAALVLIAVLFAT